jgi:uncharacterized protein (TIGR02646 family)
MEQIVKPELSEIPSLKTLEDNWVTWGIECQNGERQWRSSGDLYLAIRKELEGLTLEHCTFCDDYPIGANSTQTIEHFYPKTPYPLQTYQWENLFYCCTQCQAEANKKIFQVTLKPDDDTYSFNKYFYFDYDSGKLNILETLENEDFVKAENFLSRYGINNNPKRLKARQHEYNNVLNFLKSTNPTDRRTRDHFSFRYVYDQATEFYNMGNS